MSDTATTYTIKTEHRLLADIKAHGHGFATQREARRLVRAGWVERISGKGKGAGNTPTWGATEALTAKWSEEAAESSERTVRCLGGEWPVLEEHGDRLVILRRGERVGIPASLAR